MASLRLFLVVVCLSACSSVLASQRLAVKNGIRELVPCSGAQVLLQVELPNGNRVNGEPCNTASQCGSGVCACVPSGGMECVTPVNCQPGAWTGGACSVSCGQGVKVWTREVTPAAYGGQCLPADAQTTKSEPCSLPVCANVDVSSLLNHTVVVTAHVRFTATITPRLNGQAVSPIPSDFPLSSTDPDLKVASTYPTVQGGVLVFEYYFARGEGASAEIKAGPLSGVVKPVTATSCKQYLEMGGITSGPFNSDLGFFSRCEQKEQGGGWTLVGYERANAQETFGDLSKTFQPSVLLNNNTNTLSNSYIGPLVNGAYNEVMIRYGTNFISFSTSKNLFVDDKFEAPLTNIQTSDSRFSAWVTAAGGAVFCKARTSSSRPGDTSWGVIPKSDTNRDCGCNSGGWTGRGAYYSGSTACHYCSCYPGGFTGPQDYGQQKGTPVGYDTLIYVR